MSANFDEGSKAAPIEDPIRWLAARQHCPQHLRKMTIVHQPLEPPAIALPIIRIPVDRLTLAKRRWRGTAEDGTEIGFDLERPLADGAAVFQSEAAVYVLAQKYEPVLEVRVAECEMRNGGDAARLGWMIGNLHFQIEIVEDTVRVVDDPAVRQLFEREGIAFTACKRVFHPLSGGHRH
jgi:urease accessory protein